MKKLTLATFALGAIVAVSSIVPAMATPTTRQPTATTTEFEQAKVVIKYGNWRGHRGYRAARPGYRRHVDGYWYPRAAFSVRVAPGVRVGVGHARWCRDKYVTYRASDNTFVARDNVRRVCRSPF